MNGKFQSRFIDHLRILSENGFDIVVQTVAMPEIISEFEAIEVTIKPYASFTSKRLRGVYQDKKYPASYSKKELDSIDRYSRDSADKIYSYDLPYTLNRKCLAGAKGITVMPDGEVFRCFGYYYTGKKSMGNLFEGAFQQLNKPAICESKISSCYFQCLQFSYLEMGMNKISLKSIKHRK